MTRFLAVLVLLVAAIAAPAGAQQVVKLPAKKWIRVEALPSKPDTVRLPSKPDTLRFYCVWPCPPNLWSRTKPPAAPPDTCQQR